MNPPESRTLPAAHQRARELRQQRTPAEKALWKRLRSRRMADYGCRVLRMWNEEILTDMESVMRLILAACQVGLSTGKSDLQISVDAG